jgi:hypothetical protein
MENVEYYYDIASGNWVAQEAIEKIEEEAHKTYNRIVRKIDEATAARMFETFVRSLRK